MSVMFVPSSSVTNTTTRLGEPVESERFRIRRMRIRQWEQEQALEDIAAVRMIQSIHDSSIFPSSSVKTEFSDLDGLSWERATGRARSFLDHWTARPLTQSTSVTLPLSSSSSSDSVSGKLTIITSASFDGLPSPSSDFDVTSSTPTPTRTFSNLSHAPPTHRRRHSRGSGPISLELSSCEGQTIRQSHISPRQPPLSPTQNTRPSIQQFYLACRQEQRAAKASASLGLPPPIPIRTKRIRTPAAAQAAMLPLKVQREMSMTVRPNMRRARSSAKKVVKEAPASEGGAEVAA